MNINEVYLLSDPIENTYGSIRPIVLLGLKFLKEYPVKILTPYIKENVKEKLLNLGFEIKDNNGKKYFTKGSLLTLEAWLRRKELEFFDNGLLIINFSQCFVPNGTKNVIYYAQGPMIDALNDMEKDLPGKYKIIFKLLRNYFSKRDKHFLLKIKISSKLIIANSRFCGQMYEKYGIKIDKIIYPPMDCNTFKPTTNNPEEDYVLTYFGKETDFRVLYKLVKHGIKIKAFGIKAPYIPKKLLEKVEFLGKITDKKLVELYSNALFTLFTFNHEPFGYIPIESMACKTPVLTYNKHGPKESVTHGKTGWLANDNKELIKMALKIWKEDYPKEMREECRKEALKFDVDNIYSQWKDTISNLF